MEHRFTGTVVRVDRRVASVAAFRLRQLRRLPGRHPVAVTVAGTALVGGALAFTLVGKRAEFESALHAAPAWILGLAVVLHLVWLLARSEAWHVCIRAAGGSVGRRPLFRAASVGYLGNLCNGQFGAAVRIAALRRSAPAESPRIPVLVAAEFPILVIEGALAGLMSFTLVGPLGLPWWLAVLCLGIGVALIAGLATIARRRRRGFWEGLAVMRGLASRNHVITLVIVAIWAQIFRNWLVLSASGVDASVLDSIALLIGLGVIGLLPVGPSLGAAAAVLILGTNGVSAAAAAGVLLTATGAAGAFCFAGWALMDRFLRPPQPQVALP
jgi:uncharacterized membrane protein YbhN (UPF0104 family)